MVFPWLLTYLNPFVNLTLNLKAPLQNILQYYMLFSFLIAITTI